tara:strand:- start:318 stop:449 length:132 start_codon:yes stop_codon:yes gene_type:complete
MERRSGSKEAKKGYQKMIKMNRSIDNKYLGTLCTGRMRKLCIL